MTSKENIFRGIKNALLDMQASTSQNFEEHFLTFSRLLKDPLLAEVNKTLTKDLDVDSFLKATEDSRSRFDRIAWPEDMNQALGMKLLIIQKLANDPRKLLNFAHQYYTVGTNYTRELHSFNRQLLIPFARDYEYFSNTYEQEKNIEQKNTNEAQEVQNVPQIINYNINGHNARFNSNSIDNSVNITSIRPEISAQIDTLKNEINKSNLSEEEKSDAFAAIDIVESQIASGAPKKTLIKTLLGSLPAIENITSTVKTLFELLQMAG